MNFWLNLVVLDILTDYFHSKSLLMQNVYKEVWVIHTIMKAKVTIKELFYNYPTKQWHFEELRVKAKLSRAQTNEWLKKLQKEDIIQKVVPQGKMPYYVAQYGQAHYQNSKRLYALEQLHACGFLDYLTSLSKAHVVVLFGSFARGDWYDESDIDIFVYGNVDTMYVGKYRSILKREIQIFCSKNAGDLQEMGSGLVKNIIKGITIKGSLPGEVMTYATI